ncbi:MAG: nucleoside hydrolase [Sporolactobacillus sp.]
MNQKNVYFNHDAGIDDLVSLFLLLQMEHVALNGVSVIPADGYLTPGVQASRKIIDRFGRGAKIEVARSNSRGLNPFPKEWRMHPFFVDALPLLNESGLVETVESPLPAHQHLVKTVREASGQTTIVCTGPLTDFARALDAAPDIEERIDQLIWMGGTLLPIGNVQEPEHDGSAEWNAFWDPEAVARVWHSSVPVRMVALESTNQVPLTPVIRQHWAERRRYTGLDFLGQCYAAVPPLVHQETNSTYFLWDVLTAISAGYPDLVQSRQIRTVVRTDEPSQGKIEESAKGRPIELVYDVNAAAFFEKIEELAKRVQ